MLGGRDNVVGFTIRGPGEAKAWLEGMPTDDEVTSTVLSLRGGHTRSWNLYGFDGESLEFWNPPFKPMAYEDFDISWMN